MIWITILSYNHPEITARCVSSALRLTSPERVKLLHNGSLPKHVAFLKESFPQIEHWEVSENLGYAAGVNHALTRGFAGAEWVCLLTNDTELIRWSWPEDQRPGLYAPLIYLRRGGRVDSAGAVFNSRAGRLRHLKEDFLKHKLHKGEFLTSPARPSL